jgi:hypothetical protein
VDHEPRSPAGSGALLLELASVRRIPDSIFAQGCSTKGTPGLFNHRIYWLSRIGRGVFQAPSRGHLCKRRLAPMPGRLFSAGCGTLALLAGYDGSDGTGKLAVAYEAARCHARAAFCITGRGVRTCLSAGADRAALRALWAKPAPAAFLESRRGRRRLTAGTY